MTKIETMTIYDQNLCNLLRTQKFNGLETGHGPTYTVDINDDSSLTLTYFTARSSLVKIAYFSYTRRMERTIGDNLVIIF